MQTIHKLKRLSIQSTLHALEHLVNVRLLPHIAPNEAAESPGFDWLEKAVVTHVLFAMSQEEQVPDSVSANVQSLLDTISQQIKRPLSAKATHAAQTLIWKKAGSLTGDVVDRWCRLLKHPLFESAGQINRARIGR